MKLLDKYNRLNLTATIATFVVGSITFYLLLNFILIRELDERLQAEQQEVLTYAKLHNALPDIVTTKNQFTTYQPANGMAKTEFLTQPEQFDKESESAREIRFSTEVDGKYYLVTVGTPLEETESLRKTIIAVTIVMIGILLLVGFLINRIVIRRLWQSFYDTVNKVKTYRLNDTGTLRLADTDIDEFLLLNQSVNEMVDRIQQDYGSLKNFTSQAAHEMQTPLSVIRTRLEALMQNEALLEKDAQQIADIEKAVHRLSRLHQSLLLLTKVENRQFALDEQVNITAIVQEKCSEYTEVIESMGVKLTTNIEPVTLLFHHHLAEILIGNLLSNAVRYNRRDGSIDISLRDNALAVSNTSELHHLDGTRLFKRFYRGETALDGTGLGLSIVRQICELAGYSIAYCYLDEKHEFLVNFTPVASDFLQNSTVPLQR